MNKMTKVFIFVFVLFSFISVDSGIVNAQDTLNVDYVSSILWTGFSDVALSGNNIFCILLNGLKVLDISNQQDPLLVSELYLDGIGEGISIDGDYAYIAGGRVVFK